MIDYIKNLKLGIKVLLLGAGSVLLTAAALVSLAVWQSGQYNLLANKEVEKLINADLDHIALGIYNLVRTENEAVQQRANGNLEVLRHLLFKEGGINLAGESVIWQAVNQLNGETREISLPKMLAGGQWLGMNTDPGIEAAPIDTIVRLNGESASIFQLMNDRGDMLRVATTVKTPAGSRAIGTYIPAVNPDGTLNPVISAVMKGGTYRGTAFEVNMKCLAAYEPIKDKTGLVIGMIYAGVRQNILESRVRQAILQTNLGKTGYVYVLGGTDKLRGHYIISRHGKRDGENIWNIQIEGRYVIHDIINTALSLKPGEFTAISYRWQNPGESEPRLKIARLFYFAPWDWVVGVSVYEDELQNYKTVLSDGRAIMTDFMCLAGLFITFLIGFISIYISMTIIIPIQHITRAAEKITMGKFDQAVEVQSLDEIGLLARTFNFMAGRLNETMTELQKHRNNLEEMVGERTNELAAAKEIADMANKSKSVFLANMSHELRTPMNVILGFANIMAQDKKMDPKHKENLKLILKSGEHLLTIINNILDITKIESGKLEAEVFDFNLGELIGDLISMLRVRAMAKNLKLTLDQSSSFPRFVRTDPAKLRQIIINLVSNAIKFTDKGGITIKLGVVSMSADPAAGNYLTFEISDTGIGIAPADLERIFQPFFQAARHEGTGLGLTITRRYVQLLGGTISAVSEPEKGSSFKFTITYEPVDDENIRILRSPEKGRIIGFKDAYKYKILIVEDHKESRLLLSNILARFGFQLFEAEDGRQCVQSFKQHRPDIIFMDRRMPVMDGLQAAAEIRGIPESINTSIIAVTAHAFMEERQEMIKAGCNDFIAKPFSEERIFAVIEKYLNIRAIRVEDGTCSETPDASLDKAALAGLPETLRREFEDAIIRLDVALIGDIIRRIAGQNASLSENLENYAGRFDYNPILIALQEISGGNK